MAQETMRSWNIVDGPPLSDLLASLGASRSYASEFKFEDPRSGVKFYCYAEVFSLSWFFPSARNVDRTRDWKIGLRPLDCTALDRTQLTRGIAPPECSYVEGGYSFGPKGRTGCVRQVDTSEED